MSDAIDAIDWDLETANAEGVALVACLPLLAEASPADKRLSSFFRVAFPESFSALLDREDNSTSVSGLTSLSGRTGLD